jgi:hypothetical protein
MLLIEPSTDILDSSKGRCSFLHPVVLYRVSRRLKSYPLDVVNFKTGYVQLQTQHPLVVLIWLKSEPR